MRFLVSGIADVARVRTTWFVDPWGVVFILVEKSRPERPYFAQWGVMPRRSASSARAPAASRWESSSPTADTTSPSSTAPTASAGPGATTPSRVRPATSRRICTRTRSRSTRGGARPMPTSPRSWPTSRRWPPTTGSAHTCGPTPRSPRCAGRTAERRWTLSTDDGQEHDFDVVVSAVGMLDVPHIPDIPGAQRFRGRRVPFGALGSQQVDGGGAGRVHRHRRQRGPIRSRDRAKDRASDGVSADPDLDFAPVRLPVHPRAARGVRTRPGARRKSCATRPSTPTSHPASTSTPRRPAKRPNSPAAT